MYGYAVRGLKWLQGTVYDVLAARSTGLRAIVGRGVRFEGLAAVQ
jgi:hypothetical protein